jgi:hypothetical protein
MAFVRARTTKAGAISTALVEAYRDDTGQPRQRVLANLRGEPDVLTALAKLAARRDALRKEREVLAADKACADAFVPPFDKLDSFNRMRDRLLKRIAKVDAALVAIQKDGAVIKKHCSAAPDEIQAAIRAFKQKHHKAEVLVLGMEHLQRASLKRARAELRRLSR